MKIQLQMVLIILSNSLWKPIINVPVILILIKFLPKNLFRNLKKMQAEIRLLSLEKKMESKLLEN